MKKVTVFSLCLALLVAIPAFAGDIFVTGSDAILLHREASFTAQVFNHLGGNILLLNTTEGTGTLNVNGYTVFGTNTLTGVTLGNYSGIWVDGNCCSDPTANGTIDATLNSNLGAIQSYLAGGGNIGFADFAGFGADALFYDSLFGFAGSTTGLTAQGSCQADSTAAGVAAGFTGNGFGAANTYPDGCFMHQVYNTSFYTAHGLTSLMTDNGNPLGSVTMETATATPEPGSLVLLGSGLIGLAGAVRRRLA